MNPAAKLVAFAAGLAVVFGAAFAGGGAASTDPPGADEAAGKRAEDGSAMTTMTAGDESIHAEAGGAAAVRGLAVADDGLRLVVAEPELRSGARERLAFRIADGRGRTVRDFDVEHTKRMHVIVVRRDLTGFQHVHPRQSGDGSWSVPLRLDRAGSYRLFADFARAGEPVTLAADLRVDGAADLRPLPAASPVASTGDGYQVRLAPASAAAGEEARLRFSVTRDGREIAVEPYLGANGHLVALRDGDLAFLHVHPAGRDGSRPIAFEVTFPTAGSYRLFLQFQHGGRVHTAAFTQEVEQ